MQELDHKTISIAASKLTWKDVEKDAKKHGFNTIAGYTQYLYEWGHNRLKTVRRDVKFVRLMIVLVISLIVVLVIAGFI